jgi:flagellin-specific chaperone FliS
LRSRIKLILCGLVAGVDHEGNEVAANLVRLYDFCLHSLESDTAEALTSVEAVLRTLLGGFQQARPRALEAERQGATPGADVDLSFRALG